MIYAFAFNWIYDAVSSSWMLWVYQIVERVHARWAGGDSRWRSPSTPSFATAIMWKQIIRDPESDGRSRRQQNL